MEKREGGAQEVGGPSTGASRKRATTNVVAHFLPFILPSPAADKGRFGSYLKLCDFTLLFMTLQVELRLNKRIISETQTS